MNAPGKGLGTLALTTLALAVSGSAGAATVVPPGNSAATQYTEALPTAGGPKGTDRTQEQGRKRPPREVLGAHKTQRLQAQGAEGRAVAEVVAETAPTSLSRSSVDSGGKKTQGSGHREVHRADSGGSSPRPVGNNGSPPLGEVAAQATGSSNSGQMGFLLPLLIVATLAWASIYWLRQRKRPTA
jgi:hypothetical protein